MEIIPIFLFGTLCELFIKLNMLRTCNSEPFSFFQVSALDIIKDHELPLKKQKLSEYHLNSFNHIPPHLQATCMQQFYANLDPLYIHQCLQEFSGHNRHMSAFKPVAQSIKESKIRHATALGKYISDPPVLQNPERVIPLSETERFEQSYQPNVALAPPTPKKHRYGRNSEFISIKQEPASPEKPSEEKCPSEEKLITTVTVEAKERLVDSTVSVVQSTSNISKYNPEIELSTDTEDSASETSEKQLDLIKIEELLKIIDSSVRDKVLDFIKGMTKKQDRLLEDNRAKDNKISDLELRNSELLSELAKLKAKYSENKKIVENGDSDVVEIKENRSSCSSIIVTANNCSSEAKTSEAPATETPTSVIASVREQKESIIKTAPE